MSVKKKDRHVSKSAALGKSRELMDYILILTRPREFDKDGKQIQKPGLLGEGQPLQAFGYDIIKCGKMVHACCYDANKIYLKDAKTLEERNQLHKEALRYIESIFRQIDLCIYQYARSNKQKRRSFEYLARLNYELKDTVNDRINRDNLIFQHKYSAPRSFRRGR